ncbi:uncharacterized protein C8A04DRAFT_33180 [Dichotomopilus funicola]|uniref:T6SS Phospholipase effector Tle1-like catalytic domain-containing protein n=1 Tax=Dichotomopilus funicola TaxID=1934379 RepID=A0AAN6UUT4_9PEZI|nr:hypothetical protein C8A04DRAFT_33180 [Dichotomopilus funicola]
MATPLDSQNPQPITHHGLPKRLILCCDGTWMDSLGSEGSEPPSNVTRISRVFRRTCRDGTHQVINYFPGVGTANAIDRFTGGAFGMGLDRDIREVYNFICANYVDGDEIILIGFSRGAFTARSVADMIASIGLLTPQGLDHFYDIFDDYHSMGKSGRNVEQFLVPGLPKYGGEHGQAKIEWEGRRMKAYKAGLRKLKYTRDTYHDGLTEIRIKGIAVWDTVGTLGIPPAPVIGVENAFQALALDEPRYAFRPSLWEKLPGSPTNLKQVWFPGNHGNVGGGWHDQQMADITLAWMCDQLSTLGIEFNYRRLTTIFHESLCFSAAHPFPYVAGGGGTTGKSSFIPALPRAPFNALKRSLTKLIRGPKAVTSTTSASPPSPTPPANGPLPWANPDIYPANSTSTRDTSECTLRTSHAHPKTCFSPHHSSHHPPSHSHPHHHLLHLHPPHPAPLSLARPYALGTLRSPTSLLTTLAGRTIRRPGLALRVDETTNQDTAEPLVGTAERVHACVRVRVRCGGLGVDERGVWGEGLGGFGDNSNNKNGAKGGKGGRWRLERGSVLPEEEEVRVKGLLEHGPREVRVDRDSPEHTEFPVEAMYPVQEGDHKWKWVWDGEVKGTGAEQVPQVLALPEEPLVGYWERCLLGMMRGERDVWRYAQGESQA